MPPETAGLIGLVVLLILFAIGMPIALAAGLTGFLGVWYLVGITPALNLVATLSYSKAAMYAFTVIPLFILMGNFVFNAGLPRKAFDTAKKWTGHIPGGLAIAAVAANAAFGAVCGMSLAACSVMGRITIPEMEKLHYSNRLSTGVVAASGTLAALIPPSGVAIVYAILAEVSVGKMLIGILGPGLLTAALYSIMLYGRVKRNPSLAGDKLPRASWQERLGSVPQVWSIGVIGAVIIGGIYGGIFTPSEAGAFSAFVALLLLLGTRGLAKRLAFRNSLQETARTTAMIFLILIGILIFATFMALSELPYSIVAWIGQLGANRYVVLVGIVLYYFVLGMFMETMGMLVLSLPVVLPIIKQLGFDPIWFGVLVVKLIEVGMITPPVGLNVYVVKSVAPNVSMEEIFAGILPFYMMDIVCIAVMIAFPQIALFLPNKMMG